MKQKKVIDGIKIKRRIGAVIIAIFVIAIIVSLVIKTNAATNTREATPGEIQDEKSFVRITASDSRGKDSNSKVNETTLVQELNKYVGDGRTTVRVKDDDSNILVVEFEETGNEYEININDGPAFDSVIMPYIPSGYTHVEGTVDTGLVIEDSNGNQYVWIEVPRTAEVYPTAGVNITSFSNDDYTKIENDLHTYTSVYRNETTNTDTYYSDAATGLTSSEYTTLKKKMLKSVYKNGGFYIGRYETGIANSYRTSYSESTTPTETPIIKKDAYPYNNVSAKQAQVLSSSFASTGYTSSLMFGVQWDLVMKYLESKGTAQSELNSDSTSWGNYYNSEYSITSENALYSTDSGNTWGVASIGNCYQSLLTTGASSSFTKQNISDLAGNLFEWTLERSNSSFDIANTTRGGALWSIDSNVIYANQRKNTYGAEPYDFIGFRVALYKDEGIEDITFTYDPSDWTNESVTVTASTADARYRIQTCKDGTNWGNVETQIFTENGTIHARLIDNNDLVTGYTTAPITNIDKTAPTVALGTNGGLHVMPETGNATIKTTLTAADTGGSELNTLQYAWSTSNTVEPTTWQTFSNGSTVSKTDCTVGTYYLWTNVIDNAGNRAISVKVSEPFIVKSNTDSEALITITLSKTSWTNENITATITYGSALTSGKKAGYGSTLSNAQNAASDSTAVSLTVSENGYIYAEATDVSGNKVTKNVQVTNIDKTKPIVMVGTNGGTYAMPTTGNATIKTSLIASDTGGSNLNTLQSAWSTSNTVEPTTWETFTNGNTVSKTDCTPGTYYLWTKVTDNAGNRATDVKVSNAFIVKSNTDSEAGITITLSNTSWTNQDITATVTYGSLLTEERKSAFATTLNAAQIQASTTASTSFVISQNGYIYAEATDVNGNKVTKSVQVTNIDKNSPSIHFNPSGGAYVMPTEGNATIKTTLTAADTGGSGLNTLQYAWSTSNTKEPTTWQTFTNGSIVSKTDCTVGNYYLWTKVTDNAGNRAIDVKVNNVFIVKANTDSTAAITITLSKTSWTNQNITARITYGSALTIGKKAGYGSTLSNAQNAASASTVTSLTVSENGYIYAEATDVNGNKVTKSLQVANIDKTSPTVTLAPNGGTYVVSASGFARIETTLTAQDTGGSGVKEISYRWSDRNDIEPTMSFVKVNNGDTIDTQLYSNDPSIYLWTKVIDNAGNINIKVSNSFNVQENPQVNLLSNLYNTFTMTSSSGDNKSSYANFSSSSIGIQVWDSPDCNYSSRTWASGEFDVTNYKYLNTVFDYSYSATCTDRNLGTVKLVYSGGSKTLVNGTNNISSIKGKAKIVITCTTPNNGNGAFEACGIGITKLMLTN